MRQSVASSPYLSIIITARNDNHAGDFLTRISTLVRGLGRQAKKHPGLFELIVVEWNPPSDRPSLAEAVSWPSSFDLRIVTIPNDVHQRITRDPRMSFIEFIGKNVGLRRARGEFALTTNADVVFSDELMRKLATRTLERDVFYRTDRY